MAAEFENYKKRTRREWDLLQKKATADLLNDLLAVLDDFERAFEAAGEKGDHFFSGIKMIHSRFVEILGRAGLSEIEAKGRPFDPQFHEAMGEAESEGTEEGSVVNVVQKGYMVRDQLLRPARVIIAKKKEQ
jgi:molecular chaperone GrpE